MKSAKRRRRAQTKRIVAAHGGKAWRVNSRGAQLTAVDAILDDLAKERR